MSRININDMGSDELRLAVGTMHPYVAACHELEAEVKRLRDKLSFAISEDGLDCSMAEFEQQYAAAEAARGEE